MEQGKQKRRKLLYILIAVFLCIGILVTVLCLRKEPARRYIHTEPIDWYYRCEKVPEFESLAMIYQVAVVSEERYQFMMNMSVEAKVLEVLPDVYTDLGAFGTSDRYRVIRMQVLDVLGGENIPDEIFYRLPVQYDPDLTGYSSLILTLQQLEVANYVLVNETQQRAEAFSNLFTGAYDAEKGSVLPFLNGKLDTGLWEKQGWNKGMQEETKTYSINYLLSDEATMYPGKPYRDLRETKKAVRHQFHEGYEEEFGQSARDRRNKTVMSYADIRSKEGKELLEYVRPFENGVFKPRVQVSGWSFTRYINGFSTNEVYLIRKEDQSVWSEVRFTQEDLQQLPEVSDIVAELNRTGSAIVKEEETGMPLVFCGTRGTYQKTSQGIHCRLTRSWVKPEEESSDPDRFVFTGMDWVEEEFIVFPDGTWRKATNKDLKMLNEL